MYYILLTIIHIIEYDDNFFLLLFQNAYLLSRKQKIIYSLQKKFF